MGGHSLYHRTYVQTYATLLALLLCPALPNLGLNLALAQHPPGLQPGDIYHVIFVTSNPTSIDASRLVPPANPTKWGGIPAADWVVTFHAAIGGLPGTETWDFATPIYQAILSDPSTPPGGGSGANDAITRLNISGPIYNRQDQLVATGKADLFNGGISAPIKHDEFGFEVTGNLDVWSGTDSSGFWTGESCQDWDNPSSSVFGSIGAVGNTIPSFIFSGATNCNQSARLYGISPALMVPLLADFDGDNDTDGADLLKWQRDGGTSGQLNDWQAEYGTNANAVEASHAVPEPTTLAITLLGACTVLVCRRG